MIITLIKNRKFILGTVVLVVAVLVIGIWNPFNIMNRLFGGKLELRDTANMITEIKAIGQLVTAEYYGEVISSLDEDTLAITRRAAIGRAGHEFYSELKQYLSKRYDINGGSISAHDALKELKSSDGKRDLRRELDQILAKWFEGEDQLPGGFDYLYYSALLHIAKYEYGEDIHGISTDSKKRKGSYYDRKVHNTVLTREYSLMTEQDSSAITQYIQEGFNSEVPFSDTYLNYGDFRSPGGGREKLTLIGRGWVRAGFDFKDLNEENLEYDSDDKSIHFYGFKAKILNQDINPWFIPEKKIPGFQILNEKKADFNDMKLVKINCVQKLTQKAKEANILVDAQINGEEAMKEFFSLVMGEEIQAIYFHQESKEM